MPIEKDLRDALHRLANGVYIIAATHDGHTRGFTSTWIFQASFRHPLVAASVDKTHNTYPLIEASQSFTVSVLSTFQADIARYFGGSGKDEAEEARYFVKREGQVIPEIDGALAVLRCRIISTTDARDHSLFLAEVTSAGVLGVEQPLVYWPAGGYHVPDPSRL
jgi:flavin reductase (DIM6/NTAB) family NADH-FMN oxidoreductase RutF